MAVKTKEKKKSSLDISQIRKDFPILNQKVHEHPLVYLDNAATTQKPLAVINTLSEYYKNYNANVHRGIHALAEKATQKYEEARDKVKEFIGADSRESVIFTKGTTESINLVAYSWAREHIRQGDEIILTQMEHHSNLVPWLLLKEQAGCELKYIRITDDGILDLNHFKELITYKTKLVSLTHVSNVLGTINPVKEIISIAHKEGIPVLIDGAQSVPHLPVNVSELDCDFYVFSGHKMCGPTGSGVLYGKKELLEKMRPFHGGGEMISKVTFDSVSFNDLPWKFEAGTPSISEAIGLGTAIDYLNQIGMKEIREHEKELTQYALAQLKQLDELIVYGPTNIEGKGGVISFTYSDIHPHDISQVLDKYGVAIRSGHHSAQPLMRRLGLSATARASFYFYNMKSEIDTLINALKEVKEYFHARRRTR